LNPARQMTAPSIADTSAIHAVPKRSKRTEQNRRAKQAQRERERNSGLVKFEVFLGASDGQLVAWLREAQSGSREDFISRALVMGAKFLYNSGNVRGGKKRIKRTA
jgi:hypothetical protein